MKNASGLATTFHITTTLSFVIPSEAEGSAQFRGPFLEMFFRPERSVVERYAARPSATPARVKFYRMLTARAASKARVASEMLDCSIMAIFAQRASTGESVGENAVLVLKARKR